MWTMDLNRLLSDDPDVLPLIKGWLAMQGVTTYKELAEMTENELLALPYSGRGKVEQIRQALDALEIKHMLNN